MRHLSKKHVVSYWGKTSREPLAIVLKQDQNQLKNLARVFSSKFFSDICMTAHRFITVREMAFESDKIEKPL